MLFTETITVYSENHTKPVDIAVGRMQGFTNVEAGSTVHLITSKNYGTIQIHLLIYVSLVSRVISF
jgi:hypothetical protein